MVLAPPELAITTVRTLAMDAVQNANSGHPGGPMGLAAVGWSLFTGPLRHNPANPDWPNRDRFVLSNGHASMLLYALLHLTGYDLPMSEIKRFRRLGSITPGHPEHRLTQGVEVTTGPLGQGFGNAVGFALAERMLAARFNRPDHEIVDHRTWFTCSDGDLMEGISHEAGNLAGFWGLERLIGIYDDNHVSLDGPTSLSYGEDVAGRFTAYGWRVLRVEDANDLGALEAAYERAQEPDGRPTLIAVRTHIGFGAPHKQDTSAAHGSPLGEDEVRATKRVYGWPEDAHFLVPPEVEAWKEQMRGRGEELEADWRRRLEAYAEAYPADAEELERRISGRLPEGWDADIPRFPAGEKLATRAAGGRVMNAIAPRLPELVQGAADLSTSTDTALKDMGDLSRDDYSARNIRYGVREHGMGAITNGLAVHSGVRPACSTFLQFYDYMKNTVRLAALMEAPSIFVYTHDSVGLGEDGPTHQPIEHLAALRATPRLVTIRPGDANETAAAWRIAVGRGAAPTVLVLTRQGLPIIDGPAAVARGAYVLDEGDDCILIATGSELWVAREARARLAEDGIGARVVSMPSFELFRAQPAAYRDEVLPPERWARVSVEAASPFGWREWVGDRGAIVGIDRFGESAPGPEVLEHLGITPAAVADAARRVLAG
jgi:transketolase